MHFTSLLCLFLLWLWHRLLHAALLRCHHRFISNPSVFRNITITLLKRDPIRRKQQSGIRSRRRSRRNANIESRQRVIRIEVCYTNVRHKSLQVWWRGEGHSIWGKSARMLPRKPKLIDPFFSFRTK